MGCSGSITSELTFQQVRDKEPVVQNQGQNSSGRRTNLARGDEAEQHRIQVCGPYRPGEGPGFSSWCHKESLENCKQGEI